MERSPLRLALLALASACAQLAAGTARAPLDAATDTPTADVAPRPSCATQCACGAREVCAEGRCRAPRPSVRWARALGATRGVVLGLSMNDHDELAAGGYVLGAAVIARYAADGSALWSRRFPGDAAELRSVALDDGGLWAGGMFGRYVEVGGRTLQSARSPDGFVTRLDAAGAPLLALALGGDGDQQVATVSSLGEDALVTGYFSGAASLGATPLGRTNATTAFVARLRSDGDLAWSRTFAGGSSTVRDAVALSDGGAAVVGIFSGSLDAGGIPLRAQGRIDAFIARLDGAGRPRWAVSYGGEGDDLPEGIARDPDDNLYVVSGSDRGLTVGGVARGDAAGLLVALDPAGAVRWSLGLGASQSTAPRRVAVDAARNVIVAGTFREVIVLEGADALYASGGADLYVAIIDRDARMLSASSVGGAGDDTVAALVASPCGGFALGGAFTQRLTLGAVTLEANGTDGFVSLWTE